jgi:hypothetical protein
MEVSQMKSIYKLLTMALLTASMLAMPAAAYASDTVYGSAAAAAEEDFTMEEMLTYAIQDEYAAQAEYQAIMDKFGTSRPYSNIIRSEATHIRLLLPLFEKYGVAVPVNDAADRTIVPNTLQETYQIGVEAEIKNIEMYQSFLEEDLPADVRTVFERLSAASENHLRAFENSASETRNSDAGGKRVMGRFGGHRW